MILLLLIPWLVLAVVAGVCMAEGKPVAAIFAFLAAVAVGNPAFHHLFSALA